MIDRLAVGGAERMLVDLANTSVLHGLPVSVCITREGGELKADLRQDIEVLELRRSRRLDVPAFRRLGEWVKQRQVELIHVHGRSSFALVALARAFRVLTIPVLFHDHHGRIEEDDSIPAWFKIFGRFQLSQYVGVHEDLGRWAARAGVPEGRRTIIGNAIDLERVGAGPATLRDGPRRVCNGTFVFVAVAGIRPEKGTDVLIQAIAELPRELEVELWIVGGANDPTFAQHCRRLCGELGIEDRVTFFGVRTDVPALIAAADGGVVPSLSESGPLILIEFMALGLPFVATRAGQVAAHAEAVGVGDYVTPGDVPALAEALERLARLPPAARADIADRMRSAAWDHFDIRSKIGRWKEVYERMVTA